MSGQEATDAKCACGCGESFPDAGQYLCRHKNGQLYWPGHEPRRPPLEEALEELARLTTKWRRVETAARELIAGRFSAYTAGDGGQVEDQRDDGEKCWVIRSQQMSALEAAIAEDEG